MKLLRRITLISLPALFVAGVALVAASTEGEAAAWVRKTSTEPTEKTVGSIVENSSATVSTSSEVVGSTAAPGIRPDSLITRVKPTIVQNPNDPLRVSGDLKDPENLKSDVFYDEKTGDYKLGTKLGSSERFLDTPYPMTQSEYGQWAMRQAIRDFYVKRNREEYVKKGKEKFDFSDMKFDLGPAAKIFGPGGVRIKTQGSASMKLGANMRNVDNPTLAERNRKVFGFDFDEDINVSVAASVGDKVNMDFHYNSKSNTSFDAQKIKLRYEGKEDEIIKLIEAGNVSLPSSSGLIRGASSLFGVRTDLQFGKLKLQTVVSQKRSASTSVSSNGGVQLSSFEIDAADYDENRHFFLAHYFREHYDENMSQLPNIMSGITINRVEIWVTNKTGATTNTRDIIALADLGEYSRIGNPRWAGMTSVNPANNSNDLYETLVQTIPAARDITQVTSALDAIGMTGGTDYEKLGNARLLSNSEYDLNKALGYVSLRSTLQTDQVLAVAFEYTYRGSTYKVGEFSTDINDNSKTLFVKALKNTAGTPQMSNWDLMMKNVYSLSATSVQKENFRLDIRYMSDSSGVYVSYLPEPNLKGTKLLRLLGLDQLDNNNRRNPNSYFDYVEGYTIRASSGRIYFPVVEPFGSYLRKVIGNDAVADKYVYQELYDSTKTVAKQIAEKDKFQLLGQYRASKSNEIALGAVNIPQGSVVVTAGGITLNEGSDYTVDYYGGIVQIHNQSILDAGTPINVSLESNTDYGMQRKTMLGMNWQYDFTKNFQIGGTLMHLSEKPLTTKVSMGSEPINNTLWGLNLSWKKESQWLTNVLDQLPLLNLTAPSSINFTAEYAQLIAGKSQGAQGNASYIDDFEYTIGDIDVSNPREWSISSTPSKFSEASYSNDVRYGYNRALLAWYYIDPLFTRRSSSLTPGYIKNDLDQLSDPYVREVYRNELFPNRKINYGESATLDVLNLAYYPNERGPYNLDPNLNSDGRLPSPEKRWGGMMRRLETSDFESANVEYIEFWLMDPFAKARETGEDLRGNLYINLGEISEDVLKDGKKFYESGLPTNNDASLYDVTNWGRVPNQTSVTYAFNTQSGARSRQDVGLNGLSSEEEASFPTYANYLQQIRTIVRPEVYDSIAANPSGDKYHYFRGSDYDEARLGILDRYKYINNPNGNSVDADNSPESYSTAYKTTPDIEDINQDYTLNEYEKYYEYRVSIDPSRMQVGDNFIVDQITTKPTTRNGQSKEINWYLFRIPVDQFESRQGNIHDFSSIRFMRIYLTDFKNPVVLRFATLNLVHGQWRDYSQALYIGESPATSGTMMASAVSFEENASKTPVNYVIPPGISRVIDPGQNQILENNEQALALTIENLSSGDARAVYKKTSLDLRNYRHLQMFAHANALSGDNTLEDGQISIFLRLGTDFKNNFYEYEVPLKVTPAGKYSQGESGARAVWPEENMIDVDLSVFTDAKRNRNLQKSMGNASNGKLYSEYDSEKPANKVSVMGNPSLGDVRTMMIGVRNNSRATKSVEVWANELRLQNFANDGGWAARSNLNIQLSDFATLNLSGHVETEGFGGLEETISRRRRDNLMEYSITTNVQLGKLLPEKAKLNAPLYYSYSKNKSVPKYNPLDTDMTMDDALGGLSTKHEKDSLENIAHKVITNRNFSLSGVRFNIATKNHPMPYDPANFTFGYSSSRRYTTGETTAWETDESQKLTFAYNYSPNYKTFEPFAKLKGRSKWVRFAKELGFNYLPQNVAFNSEISRTYYEFQERDIENLDNNSLPLSWASDFLWNRSFQLRWDFTKNIHASFSSATNAEIEQPYTAVNKDLYPDRYSAWKDSVWHSIQRLGEPLAYQQTFDLSWRVPINRVPIFEWINADASYNATYNWTRGSQLDNGTSLGNTIANARSMNGNLKFNLETLYNYSPFLKKANQKYKANTSSSSSNKKQEEKKKNFEKEITLKADTTQTLQHNQKSKKVRVVAIKADGSRYPLRYKVKDANSILILSQDTVPIKVTVSAKKRTEDQTWYRTLQVASRIAMMVRNVSISYRNTYNMSVPGFLPKVGDILGQRSRGGLSPGLDFAFGLTDEHYLEKAADRGWLLMSDDIITPATTSETEDLQIRATLEPWPNLKIDLNAMRNRNTTRSIQYMYAGMPRTETGSFKMTTISIHTAFASIGNADNSYSNTTFRKFIGMLEQMRSRVEAQYSGTTYPQGTSLAGKTFDPTNGTVSPYSADVMVPAFLDTYTLSGGALDIFPALLKMLPNWSITYNGLAKIPSMKRIFKSFNLNHSYKSTYDVGSYSTFSSWVALTGGRGFASDVTTGMPIPTSMYDVSTVSISESFSPLFGVDMTFLNGMTGKLELRKTRQLSLSMTSQKLTETHSHDYVIGVGYKINNLNLFAPKRTVKSKRSSKKSGNNDEGQTQTTSTNSRGFSNDLNLKLDITLRNQTALSRDILTGLSQATSGNKALQISFSADYALSKFLTVTAYYDRQTNTPLMTSSSYPVTTRDFGVSLKFSLTR